MLRYGLRMRTTTRIGGLGLVALVTLLLAGCVNMTPRIIPTSSSASKPVFATDAAALAAAKKAYVAYLAVSDEVAHKGGDGVGALQQFDTPGQFDRDTKGFAEMKADGHHSSGSSTFTTFELQRSSTTGGGLAEVVAYVCIDISRTTLLNEANQNVGKGRPLQLPLAVSFESVKKGSRSLLIERSDSWNGSNFCS